MAKLAFVGAGSLGFTRRLIADMMSYEELADSTVSLIDIDAERLAYAKRAVDRIMQVGGYPAKVEATTDRKVGLKDADIVIITILVHGPDGVRAEIEIPMKYGISFNVGDSYGTAAVFRTLRTLPPMLDICRDVERYAPDAYVFNYTNPMSMLCRGINAATSVKLVGLCHSVQGMGGYLGGYIGARADEIVCECAGINHQSWVVRFERSGKNAYPELYEALRDPRNFWKDPVRNEMCLALGYYVTESSRHNSEYNWWFRKRPDLMEHYFKHSGEWDEGQHGIVLSRYRREQWEKELKAYAEGTVEVHLGRSHEYASRIALALLHGDTCTFNATVPNTGLITNLPDQSAVEVPVVADRGGFHPIRVGELPKQCAALNLVNTTVVEFAVEAALNNDKEAAFRACCFDPLAAAKCSLPEIKQMVDELFEAQRPFLPQFEGR
ncbi:MAG: alpha-glucosidase/alpha-galactosidase [Armatimonadota bacterium]